MQRRMVALLACVLMAGTAGCGSDAASDGPAANAERSAASATSEATESTEPTEPAESVQPPEGRQVDLGVIAFTAPRGWRLTDQMMEYERATYRPDQAITFGVVAAPMFDGDGAVEVTRSLDELLVTYREVDAAVGGPMKVLEPRVVQGVEMLQVRRPRSTATTSRLHLRAVHENRLVSLNFTFDRDLDPATREDLVDSLLAGVVWQDDDGT